MVPRKRAGNISILPVSCWMGDNQGDIEGEKRVSGAGEIVRVLKICNKRGLHARASAKFVKIAEKFDAQIMVSKDGHVVGGTSIMGLMMLAAGNGCEIRVSVSGRQSGEAIEALQKLVDRRFDEAE